MSNLPDNVTDQMIDDHFGSPDDCEKCEGDGQIPCPDCEGLACDLCEEGTVECPDCDGDGYGLSPEETQYERDCERADRHRDEMKDRRAGL